MATMTKRPVSSASASQACLSGDNTPPTTTAWARSRSACVKGAPAFFDRICMDRVVSLARALFR